MTRWFLLVLTALFVATTAQADCPLFGEAKRATIIYDRTTHLLVVKGEGGYISGVGLIINEREEGFEPFELTPQAEEGNWYNEGYGCIGTAWTGVAENSYSLDATVNTVDCPEDEPQACLSAGRIRLGWLHGVTEIRYAKVFDENRRPYRRLRIRYVD